VLIWDLVTLPFCTFLARFTSSWPSTMALSTSSWSLLLWPLLQLLGPFLWPHLHGHLLGPSTPSWTSTTSPSTPSWPVFKTQSDHIARFLQSKVFMLRAFKNTKQSCCTFLSTQCVNVVFSKMLSVHVAF